ncbi:MAG: S24/S26 family peptidase, partial [Prevotellaceae bacterium]|nr:S24/S26 family peptidase [Prevotellaceae bacterium]
WLLTGEGDMLSGHDPRREPTEFPLDKMEKARALAEELGVELIPMFSEPFKGGNDGYPLAEDINEVESVWTMPDVRADMIVPVVGDSMAPTFPQGSRLAVSRVWFRPDEPLSIPFGEAFAIVLHDPDDPDPKAITDYVKRLYKHDDPAKRREYWIARSDNDMYEDFEIPISHVVGLWRVRASVAYFA